MNNKTKRKKNRKNCKKKFKKKVRREIFNIINYAVSGYSDTKMKWPLHYNIMYSYLS